jgi:hypothetical protein
MRLAPLDFWDLGQMVNTLGVKHYLVSLFTKTVI